MPDKRTYRVATVTSRGVATVTTGEITADAAAELERQLNELAARRGGQPTTVIPTGK